MDLPALDEVGRLEGGQWTREGGAALVAVGSPVLIREEPRVLLVADVEHTGEEDLGYDSTMRPCLIALTLLLCAACEQRVELTVLPSGARRLEAPREDAPVADTLPPGTRLVGVAPRFGSLRFYRQQDSQPARYLLPTEVAPFPLPGTRYFVTAPSTVRFAWPRPGAEVRGRLAMATPVEILETGGEAGRFVALLEGGVVAGFVERAHLAPQPPRAEALLKQALEALRRKDFSGATWLLEGVLGLERSGPHHEAALELTAALLNQVDWERASRARRELGEARPWPVLPPAQPPQAATRAWVVASLLKLRSAPSARARKLADLPIRTPVHVESLQGEWARVRVGMPGLTAWDMGALEAPRPRLLSYRQEEGAAPQELSGFVAARYLDRKMPSAEGQRAAAEQALQAGRRDEAVLHLQRALALEPADPALALQLFDTAVQARRFEAAVLAMKATPPVATAPSAGGLEAGLTLVWGCKGALERAVMLGPDAPPEEDACLAGVDTLPPCLSLNPAEAFEEDVSPEVLEQAQQQLKEENEAILRAFRERLEEQTRGYQGPPRLRVELHNPQSSERGLEGLFLYHYHAQVRGYCDVYEVARKDAITVVPLPLPPLGPGSRVQAWVEVPGYEGEVYGLVQAASEEQARALVEALPLPLPDVELEASQARPSQALEARLAETAGPLPSCFNCGC